MRAATYERTGDARDVLQIVDLPRPEPAAGEVRVRLEWSGVNPSDVKTRAATRTKVLAFPRITPHSDGGGVIDAVGTGIDPGRVGERVWIWNGAWGRPNGTAAEFITVPAAQAVRLPTNVGTDVGACLGIPALTALHAVTVDGGIAGKSVLIAGGAGAVGHYAIQFARLHGAASILTTVSSAQKAAIASQAGADTVINYKTEDVESRVREVTAGTGVDRVIEVNFSVNSQLDLQVLKPDADIVAYGSDAPDFTLPFVPLIAKNVRLRFFMVYILDAATRTTLIDDLTSLLAGDRLKHNISARLPLDRIAEAHELVESGRSNGKVVVAL
ncbi:NADPH:quinone reductase [Povalibacter sp.]|uniref:NADPH:quinone reductase n=1 Tax=Povalibacter sp. TaxID=1962978 RepID=UPI002F3F3919